jgi:Domain of unknown function (DUF4148)
LSFPFDWADSVVYKQPGYALTRALPLGPSLPLHSNEVMMKTLTITTLLGLAISTSAFAQSQAQPTDALPSNVNNAKVVAQTGQWVPPDGQTIAPKTRAQVYQELVEAEKDGQLAYLNSTVYAHS